MKLINLAYVFIFLISLSGNADPIKIFIEALESANPGYKFNRFNEAEIREKGKLSLENKNISILPPQIGMLVNLTYLNLGGNNLKVLPTEIGSLVNLKLLGLNKNNLSELPKEMWQLTKLEALHLHENQLNSLSAEIGKLEKFVWQLSLRDNKFTEMPAEIGDLGKIKLLLLQGNSLASKGQNAKSWGKEELQARFGSKVHLD